MSDSTASRAAAAGSRPLVGHLIREYARANETFVVNQIASQTRYTPTVLCHRRLPTQPGSTLGGEVRVLDYETSHSMGRFARATYRLARIMMPRERRFYADGLASPFLGVVHAHYGTDAAFFLPAVRDAGKSLIVSYYGYDVSAFPRAFCGLGRHYMQPLWRSRAWHLAMTPKMAADLVDLGVPRSRIQVHHHGIDTAFWTTEGVEVVVERPYILQVGSLHPVKGQDYLLQAFQRLAPLYPDLDVHLVGRGPFLEPLTRLASRLGLADRVRFLGHMPHGDALRVEYANATVFCHPSQRQRDGREEGLPGTILEAMSCGRAVVSTRHGGIPFAVRQGQTGLLTAEGDVLGLAEALHGLVRDEAMRESYGRAGRRLVRAAFDVRVQGARLEGIYDEAIRAATP